MATWELRWNFSQENYQPNSSGIITFNVENLNNTTLFVSDIGIQFDWMGNEYYHVKLDEGYGNVILPRKTQFITNLNFTIPKTVSGQRFYRIYYHLYEYNEVDKTLHDLGDAWSDNKYFINIFPLPYYRTFLTRSLSPEDRIAGDEILRIIREWGFADHTVEFKEKVSDNELRETIRNEILNSDCLIAIASPRYLDALSGVWRTFSYLHSEVGIAFGHNFPILILVDNRVAIDGLPSTLREYMIQFDLYNYEETRKKISAVMPAFRNYVSNKKWEEFTSTLGKIALGTGLVLLGGIAASLLASSKK